MSELHPLSHTAGSTADVRVARLALEVVRRQRVPAEASLSTDAVEDVRACAAYAVWLAARRDPGRFVDEHGELRRDYMTAYLRRALRKAFDEIRRVRKHEAAIQALAPEPTAPDVAVSVIDREARRELIQAVRRLSPAAQEVVIRRLAKWSFQRIALELGATEAAVRQRYSRARRALPASVRHALPPSHARGR